MRSDAVISRCGNYRYSLTRKWGAGERKVAWLMLNPSTADAWTDDATIRKCIGFSMRWGFHQLEVVNLFALRSSDPKSLRYTKDPFGPDNMRYVLGATCESEFVVCAWGCESELRTLRRMGRDPFRLISESFAAKLTFQCLGRSKSGNPYHPLMLPYSTPLQSFDMEGTLRGKIDRAC